MLTLCYVAQKKPAGKRIVLRDALEKCEEMGIYMEMLDVILDAVIDTVKLIPFLFLTYLAMEYLEHKTGSKAQRLVQRAGRFGPVIGGLLALVPQCGFSAGSFRAVHRESDYPWNTGLPFICPPRMKCCRF